ncbi:hypothetical protein MS3_00009701 [Schistosoma haematobium]|nr:hypothetical protein MS3_00009701 [Schistosoma haematobium]KAH9579607.1 hypothetical protein MS3_00009701 [Schistosoma haematobium]CAH8636606.1 unnamed protein product [Schistosoma haematobium]CAH8643590.1 unnamed protein product [Schistosoma haematobium]
MLKYLIITYFTVLLLYLDNCSPEIFSGIADLNHESDYFAKFCFLSSNSSIQFEFAFLENTLPVKLKSFWDAPGMWLAASQRPLFSCFKKQALLNSLSANQLFHLDPFMDRWCQRISLSDKIYDELMIVSNEEPISWASVMTTMIKKISGYFNRLEEIPERKSPTNHTSYNGTTALPLNEVNLTDLISVREYQQSRTWFPEVITMAWSYFKSNIRNEQDSFVLSQWIYCQSPNIPLIVNRPSWWFFTFDSCNELKLDNMIETSMKSQQLYTKNNKIAYRLTLKNGENGDLFHEHFSSQEFGKLEIDLLFFILLGSLFIVANLLLFRLYRSNLLHHTVVLWYTSISLRFLAQLIQLIVDINFAKTGYFNSFNTSLAYLFYSASISCFYASLVVLGSGFTIVYQTVPHNHMIAFLILSISYALINLSCQISMGLTHYEVGIFSRYHSQSGYVYLGLQLFSYIAYLFICSYTCIKWSGKRIFFIRFMAISCIWFWTVPLWIILSMNYIYTWYMETLIRLIDELIHFTGFIVMMVFLRPDKTNLIFPYHTSAISTIISRKKDDNDNWETKLVTETVSSTSTTTTTTTKSPQLSIIPMKKNVAQTDNTKSVNKKVSPPQRPNPPRLFNLTGKPGDLPAPGSVLTSGLSELSKTPMNSPKRPQTTPNLNSGVNSPRLQTIDKAGSTH